MSLRTKLAADCWQSDRHGSLIQENQCVSRNGGHEHLSLPWLQRSPTATIHGPILTPAGFSHNARADRHCGHDREAVRRDIHGLGRNQSAGDSRDRVDRRLTLYPPCFGETIG